MAWGCKRGNGAKTIASFFNKHGELPLAIKDIEKEPPKKEAPKKEKDPPKKEAPKKEPPKKEAAPANNVSHGGSSGSNQPPPKKESPPKKEAAPNDDEGDLVVDELETGWNQDITAPSRVSFGTMVNFLLQAYNRGLIEDKSDWTFWKDTFGPKMWRGKSKEEKAQVIARYRKMYKKYIYDPAKKNAIPKVKRRINKEKTKSK